MVRDDTKECCVCGGECISKAPKGVLSGGIDRQTVLFFKSYLQGSRSQMCQTPLMFNTDFIWAIFFEIYVHCT